MSLADDMFLGADKIIFQRADALRKNQTETEIILWNYLKQKPLGYKFRRQHPLSTYIADFYCHSLKLIIEIDGGIHLDEEVAINDIERQKNLEAAGINFLRFTDQQVIQQIENVIASIEKNIATQVGSTSAKTGESPRHMSR